MQPENRSSKLEFEMEARPRIYPGELFDFDTSLYTRLLREECGSSSSDINRLSVTILENVSNDIYRGVYYSEYRRILLFPFSDDKKFPLPVSELNWVLLHETGHMLGFDLGKPGYTYESIKKDEKMRRNAGRFLLKAAAWSFVSELDRDRIPWRSMGALLLATNMQKNAQNSSYNWSRWRRESYADRWADSVWRNLPEYQNIINQKNP